MQPPKRSKWNFFQLSTQQQVVFVILMVIGIGGFALGAQSFGTNIRRPFVEQLQEYAQAGAYLTPEEREAQEMEELKTKDSDGDGLSDYDELHVFNTSPYLADTDSDGFDDQTEVYSNNDPNCPEGEDCLNETVQEEGVGEDGDSPDQILNPAGSESVLGNSDTSDLQSQLDQLNNLDQMLSDGQASNTDVQDQLNNIEDGLGGTGSEGVSDDDLSNMDLNSQNDLMSFFDGLSADQIRAAMVDAGIPESQIEGLSDEEVKELFDEAVAQAQENGALSDFAGQIDDESTNASN